MQLVPYLFFDGVCEEALAEYARIFAGKITMLSRYSDAPAGAEMPPGIAQWIMHATLEAPGFSLMASDTADHGKGPMARASISVAVPNVDEGRRIFDELSAGGTIVMPFEKQFWGATFGSFSDRFGISWMVNAG